MNAFLRLLPCCIILAILFTGCTQTAETEQTKIKVMYDNEYSFQSEYGNVFAVEHPNIELEVSEITVGQYEPGGINKLKKELEQEKPDVLYLTPEQYKELLREGKLTALDGLIKTSNYSLNSFHSGILDILKQMGDGELFGLAPIFDASALFYNKELFDRYHIEYPTDQMTWDQVLQLAQRFPGKDESGEHLYGLSLQFWESTPSGLLERLNGIEGLADYDFKQKKILIKTDANRKNAEKAVALFEKEVIPYYEIQNGMIESDDVEKEPFITGNSAMYLGSFTFFNTLVRLTAENGNKMQWDMVTEPINPQFPDQAVSFSLIKIFAINAESSNQQAAWQFIQFANSDSLAKLKSKSNFFLQSRTGTMNEKNGHSLEPFYKLKFTQSFSYPEENLQLFLREYGALKRAQFKEVLDHNKTLNQALETIEAEGQLLLGAASLQPNDSEQQAR
ncbi:ABC transporter substrate-binding protein [Paenibacillus radicis (ex Gao et al. 2016)]|uniref:Extracellular solute-binding protein n=1 Tax=Paenibacillus radicis (ex Gao et al. 2016) TaxID=1737354 RepID=A0A917GXT2_9BACL|nr:ABC transporter substrate-binding protein [Paenibacillus radicis (ex Gao et al. 2016)]GGG59892.1 hypothetical protein GCM10010918_11360 [Paenibacillus radicis (ex Gao et al. 2016)]